MASLSSIEQVLKFVEGNVPEAKVRSSTSSKLVLESEIDRSTIKEKLHESLKAAKIKYEEVMLSGSSFPGTKILPENISILYKSLKGGMAETTLNSSITELFPCIAFTAQLPLEEDPGKFYSKVYKSNKKTLPCYIGEDWQKGKEYVDKAETSTKFESKVKGAIAVFKFIMDQNKGKPIQNAYWGFRAKPTGVNSSHKGDIFLFFNDGKKLGVSIKSGSEATAEPKFNSYVRPIMEKFGKLEYYESLRKEAHDNFYIGIPKMPIDYKSFGSQEFKNALAKHESSKSNDYEKRYNEMLIFVKNKLIDMFNKHQDLTKKWLIESVVGDQSDVPLVVVKAIETTAKYEIKDDNIVKACVVRSKKQGGLVAESSPTNKQDFYINLTCNSKTTTLLFSIRTNKPGVDHKLGQGINLAVKFNGVKK